MYIHFINKSMHMWVECADFFFAMNVQLKKVRNIINGNLTIQFY